jgi:hypothetical protein
MKRLDLCDLIARRRRLERSLPTSFDASERGGIHLELGVLAKLLDGPEGIERAFFHLRTALELLPEELTDERQRALFVLGLTHGDVSEPAAAVERFEEVDAIDEQSPAGSAARAYARAYRDHFSLAG